MNEGLASYVADCNRPQPSGLVVARVDLADLLAGIEDMAEKAPASQLKAADSDRLVRVAGKILRRVEGLEP